jgi:UDP-N-acetylglucosamine 2-epimerase (non-hydrolysing)
MILKVACVFGTRPEAIKMAPVVLEMRRRPEDFQPIVCVTGQHREMLDQVLETFGIRPDHDLAVMTENQTLAELSSRVIQTIDGFLERQQPDVVLVQGDTTSAFITALAAFYRKIPCAHVEAGLRTGDFEHPFPEEANRVLIDRVATLCFAPTELNRRALLAEGVPEDRIFVTGNSGIDALLLIRQKVRQCSSKDWEQCWRSASAALADPDSRIVLVTAHRRESFGERIKEMFLSLRELATCYPDWHIIYPVHPNPNVTEPARDILGALSNVHLIEPLPYEAFVYLMDRSSLIVTDSGGVQEEAPSLAKLVIVMRERTERVEALESGTVILAGNSGKGLVETVARAIADPKIQASLGRGSNPYGDGHAAERIVSILAERMNVLRDL